jgi:hypothetical protein
VRNALRLAIRALARAIEILDSVIAYEEGALQKGTVRDGSAGRSLTDMDRSVEKDIETSGRDRAIRNLAEHRRDRPDERAGVANARTRSNILSDCDTQRLLEIIDNPPAANQKLKKAIRDLYKEIPSAATKGADLSKRHRR